MKKPAVVRAHERKERALYNLKRAARAFAAAARKATELVQRGPEDDSALEPALEAIEVQRAAGEQLEQAALKWDEADPAPRRRARRPRPRVRR